MTRLAKMKSGGGRGRSCQEPKMRRSCEACALAKRRCDGAVTCSRCSKYSVPCVYRKRHKSGPKVHTPPDGRAVVLCGPATPTSKGPKVMKRRPFASAVTSVGPQREKKTPLSFPRKKGWQQPLRRHQKREQPTQRQPSAPTAGRSPAAAQSLGVGKAVSERSPAPAPTSSPSSPKKGLCETALPPQQLSEAASKKQRLPHPRHADGQLNFRQSKHPGPVAEVAPASRSTDITLPPVGRLLELAKSEAAATAAAAMARSKLTPLTRMLPSSGVLPTGSTAAMPAMPGSGSSFCGGFSPLSWIDVPAVFESTLEDELLWDYDDSSKKGGEGGAMPDVNGEELFPTPDILLGFSSMMDETLMSDGTGSPTVETTLFGNEDGISSPTGSHLAHGFVRRSQSQQHQQPTTRWPPSAPLQSTASLPSSVSPFVEGPLALCDRTSGGGSGVARSSQYGTSCNGQHEEPSWNKGPSVTGVLPALRSGSQNNLRSTSTEKSSRREVFKAVDYEAGISSPVLTWSPEAVEASTSTLLAIFADTGFRSASSERETKSASDGKGFPGGLQQHQRHQRYL